MHSVFANSGRGNNPGPDSPFDLIEEVKDMNIEVGKWYKTEAGDKAYVAYKRDNREQPYYGHVNDVLLGWREDGISKYFKQFTLIEEWKEPKSGVVYVNIYARSADKIDSQAKYRGHWASRSKADEIAEDTGEERLACVRVEWKEGQFDE